ncbi:MAG: acyl--CoA ligase [Dehalococcoidia bacterium]|nr:acyl--CoA ligase [Dehalococcoidia bacterium]
MPKTIAITPSWYWPAGIPRVFGIPPFSLAEICVGRNARDHAGDVALASGRTSFTAADLQSAVRAAAATLVAQAGPGGRVVLTDDLSAETVVHLLGALAAGLHVRLVPRNRLASATAEAPGAVVVENPGAIDPTRVPASNGHHPDLATAAVTIDGPRGPVSHTHRSLLASALNIITFLDARPGRPWAATLPLSRWEGLISVLIPLYLGSPLLLTPATGDPEEIVRTAVQHQAGYMLADLDAAALLTREAKKSVKDARRMLDAVLLATPGMFDADERRRVAKSFESPALTFWGMPETGPIFASHPSWYIDESIGIPLTNVHVVPADPRTGAPLQALWELVESAEVTVRTPGLMYTGSAGEDARFVDHRFRTGMIASSDANGMIYLLGEQ